MGVRIGSTIERSGFDYTKSKISESLTQIENILAPYAFINRIQSAQERLHRETMHLLVIGEFSRGKSTFINALLGRPILPSKVNPTTATIGIIEGSTEKRLSIDYHNGETEEMSLPDDKVNKFLDQYLTTVNKQANQIKQVRIKYPSFLEELKCLIVDTPGVNDLDDLREEVTFNYLSKADACIVLLDSQQPLSESERRFLKERVLKNDIHRLLFVVNRMDEVEEIPNGSTSQRLTDYVAKLLAEQLPSISPVIHTVSSKEALRARYKGETSNWEQAFNQFQEQLLVFISNQASRGRLPQHVDRALNIILDGLKTLQEQDQLLHLSDEQLREQLCKFELERELLTNQMVSMNTFLEKETRELTRWIIDFNRSELSELQKELLNLAELCQSDEDILRLKSRIGSGMRDLLEEMTDRLKEFRRDLNQKMLEQFLDLFQSDNQSLSVSNSSLTPLKDPAGLESISFNSISISNDFEFTDLAVNFAIGGTLGYLGAAILGPIGIAAAVVGSFFLGSKLEEEKRAKEFEAQRQKIVSTIRSQIDEVIRNAEYLAQEAAQKQIAPIGEYYRERVESRVNSLKNMIDTQLHGIQCKHGNLSNEREAIRERVQDLERIYQELVRVKGELL